MVLTVVIGAIVGLVVVVFILLTENLGSRLYPGGGSAWRRLLVPVAGALGTGFLLFRYFPDARGSGIPQTKVALFLRDGYISLRTVIGKFSLCSASLASGIALGREGPSVQVGAGVASVLGRRLGLSPERVKSLVPVGASAALAAAFNTPIAAVLFSLEEVMGDMHAPVLGSIVLSSATSWMVLHLILGDEPLFHVPAYQLVHPLEFAVYAVLGVVGGVVSTGFVKLLLWQRKHFLSFSRNFAWAYPAVGGLTVGILGWFVPDVLGVGYATVGKALNGQLLIGTMALLVALKLVATATCYASGNAGGIFGPSLFIGAMLGGAVGGAAHWMLPDYTGSVGAYALVGMGVAFAGIVRVPLTSVIMIFEMTRDYSIIVPLMIANLVSYAISSRLQEEPIYEALQHQDGVHLPTGAREREELLTVAEGFHAEAHQFAAADTIGAAATELDGKREWWPVVDANGLRGMLSSEAILQAVREGRTGQTLATLVPDPGPRAELVTENFPHVHPDHTLDTAMQRIARSGISVLPVVSRTNVRELLGTISRHDIFDAYARNAPASPAPPEPSHVSGQSATLLVRTLTVLFVVALGGAVMAYYYRAERGHRAQEFYKSGEDLIGEGRPGEAVEQFRNALSITHSVANRQALGLALVEAGRDSEAAIYLQDVLRVDPNNGPTNLGMARVLAKQAHIEDAVSYYRRAANGSWPFDPVKHRVETRLELVDVLDKAGMRPNAQAQLMLVAADAPQDPAIRKQLAEKLTALGMQKEAVALLREMVATNPRDGEAWAALGEVQFALADYKAARDSFTKADQLGSGHTVQSDAAIVNRVLDLDPTARGLSVHARYDRSIALLNEVLHAAAPCSGETDALKNARAAAAPKRRRPASYSDAVDENVDLAEEVWSQRPAGCGGDRALDLLLASLK